MKGNSAITGWESRLRVIDEMYVTRANERYLMNYVLGEEIKDN